MMILFFLLEQLTKVEVMVEAAVQALCEFEMNIDELENEKKQFIIAKHRAFFNRGKECERLCS